MAHFIKTLAKCFITREMVRYIRRTYSVPIPAEDPEEQIIYLGVEFPEGISEVLLMRCSLSKVSAAIQIFMEQHDFTFQGAGSIEEALEARGSDKIPIGLTEEV